MSKVNDVYSLKAAHEAAHPNSHFFDRDTLKFFGETLSSMRLLKRRDKIKDIMGETHTCYVLSTVQRVPFVGKKRKYHYFDTETLEDVCPA